MNPTCHSASGGQDVHPSFCAEAAGWSRRTSKAQLLVWRDTVMLMFSGFCDGVAVLLAQNDGVGGIGGFDGRSLCDLLNRPGGICRREGKSSRLVIELCHVRGTS